MGESSQESRAVTALEVEHRQRFSRLLHRGLDLGGFFDAADHALASLIEFDSSCWLSFDPSTLLPTSHFTRQIDTDHLMELAANEFLEEDVNKFAVLARAATPVGLLSEATGGDLQRSPRFVNVLAPHGYGDGDELRAAFLDGAVVWGGVALHRRRGRFVDREASVVADVSRYIGEGIRRAILVTALATESGFADSPGLILLRSDDSIESMTPAARHWLAELFDPTSDSSALPLIVVSVADMARRAGAGQTEQVAGARVPRKSGGWLLLHASLLDGEAQGRVGVMLHPAKQPEIAALIVEAYGLSRREREVTRLVLRGYSTVEMANDLHVSPYTVQDHLKAIFAKVGVSSRRELVASVFLQHYAPRLETGASIGWDGWFADDSARPPRPHEGASFGST
jgi:DNA-binding CsgD family transcriptional regulator